MSFVPHSSPVDPKAKLSWAEVSYPVWAWPLKPSSGMENPADQVTARSFDVWKDPPAQPAIWGMTYPFSEVGVPSVSYGGLPAYLMAITPDSYLGRISKVRLSAETNALLRALRALDGIPQIAH
jgi:hypothetical protein